MPFENPFRQTGPTVVVTAASTPPLGVQARATYEPGSQQYLVTNSGGNVAFVGVGATATEAQTRASGGAPVLHLQRCVLTGPVDAFFSGTTVTGAPAAALFITPGYGQQ